MPTSAGQGKKNYNVLHYAGHADYDLQEPAQSGWWLADGKLTAQDVMQLGATATLPALVFCKLGKAGQGLGST